MHTMRINKYHTVTPEKDEPNHRAVYHDLGECPDGMRIKPENRRTGNAGRPKCDYGKTRK
jgi:hypothetical protein